MPRWIGIVLNVLMASLSETLAWWRDGWMEDSFDQSKALWMRTHEFDRLKMNGGRLNRRSSKEELSWRETISKRGETHRTGGTL